MIKGFAVAESYFVAAIVEALGVHIGTQPGSWSLCSSGVWLAGVYGFILYLFVFLCLCGIARPSFFLILGTHLAF